jgi:protein-tyrosine-phosphatase
MKELGIGISGPRSKQVDELRDQSFDYLLTICNNAKEIVQPFRAKQSAFTRHLKTRQPFKAPGPNV